MLVILSVNIAASMSTEGINDDGDGLSSAVSGSEQTLCRGARLPEYGLHWCICCRVYSENYCLQSKGLETHSVSLFLCRSHAVKLHACFCCSVFLVFDVYGN